MTNETTVRYAELQADDVKDVMRTEGTWIGSHALLQRSKLVRDGEELGAILRVLTKRREVQHRSGQFGMEYALVGVEQPEGVSSAPLRASQLHQALARDGKVKGHYANGVVRHVRARDRWDSTHRDIIALFKIQPRRTARQIQKALGKNQSWIALHLKALREAKLIDKVGHHQATEYVWVEGALA